MEVRDKESQAAASDEVEKWRHLVANSRHSSHDQRK